MKTLLSLLLLLATGTGFSQTVKNVNAEEFKKMIDAKKGEVIDLRTTNEIESKGKIRDSKQLDYLAKDSEEQIKKLDKNKTYLIYCAGGGRSGQAAELMQKLGFKEVVNLEKGFDDWKRKGFEIEQKH
jgi:rhodanese-related sulfurtransferase